MKGIVYARENKEGAVKEKGVCEVWVRDAAQRKERG